MLEYLGRNHRGSRSIFSRAKPIAFGALFVSSIPFTFIHCGGDNPHAGIKPVAVPKKLPQSWPENRTVPARAYWPTANWKTRSPAQADLKADALKKLTEYAFTRTGDDTDRKGIRTDGVVVVHRGYIVYEKYARGFKADTRHLIWSDTKSFTNALFGIAVKDGLFKTEEPAHKYFPALNQGDKAKITINHLLRMSSGLHWAEGYEASPLKSTVVKMLYTSGRGDMAGFAAAQPLVHKPNTFWYYSSGTSNLLQGILKNRLGAEYGDYPWKKLFNPIGIKSAVWEKDAKGTYVGSSYLYMTPRDMARFGFLFLNDGVWSGKRILAEGWVAYSTTLAPGFYQQPVNEDFLDGRQGAQWWLNLPVRERGTKRPHPDAPADTFMARGHEGQYIFVIPSLDIVAVRVGDDKDGSFSINEFLKYVVRAAAK